MNKDNIVIEPIDSGYMVYKANAGSVSYKCYSIVEVLASVEKLLTPDHLLKTETLTRLAGLPILLNHEALDK